MYAAYLCVGGCGGGGGGGKGGWESTTVNLCVGGRAVPLLWDGADVSVSIVCMEEWCYGMTVQCKNSWFRSFVTHSPPVLPLHSLSFSCLTPSHSCTLSSLFPSLTYMYCPPFLLSSLLHSFSLSHPLLHHTPPSLSPPPLPPTVLDWAWCCLCGEIQRSSWMEMGM